MDDGDSHNMENGCKNSHKFIQLIQHFKYGYENNKI